MEPSLCKRNDKGDRIKLVRKKDSQFVPRRRIKKKKLFGFGRLSVMQLGSLIELNCYTEEGCICHIVFEIYCGRRTNRPGK